LNYHDLYPVHNSKLLSLKESNAELIPIKSPLARSIKNLGYYQDMQGL